MIGAGVDGSFIELGEQISALGLEGSVRLLGEQKDLPKVWHEVDCLVSTSYGEGFPNVIAEAILSGVPVVATGVGETATLIGKFGTVVEAGDYKGLAQGVKKTLELSGSQRLMLINGARNWVSSKFAIQAVVAQFFELYQRKLK